MKKHLEYLATILSYSSDLLYDDIVNQGLFLDSSIIIEKKEEKKDMRMEK